MTEHAYEPPSLDAYFDFVVAHLEEELTREQIAQEARFMREADAVRLRHAEDPEAALAAIAAHLGLEDDAL